ncbi:MAG: ornithine aminotransferase [Crocinitomicaceae bacterium]|jgi:osmotically-inducible protein OsmY|nr:ornithine aminotransferase [Crocinitomicaceae bacterium]
MRRNDDLQYDVSEAIRWEPLLKDADIHVSAQDGVVTLTGTVNSYIKKLEAEDAAKRIAGVKAVVDNIEIKLHNTENEDEALTGRVQQALGLNSSVPHAHLTVHVQDGWVNLHGDLPSHFEKEATLKTVKGISGVRGVINHIKIISDQTDQIEKDEIERALKRNWAVNEKDIEVQVIGNVVKLRGTVGSIFQREEAEKIARNAPGILGVSNELLIEYRF